MWANFSCASANFCVTFLNAVFRGPTAFSFRPEFSLTGHLFRLMLGVCYWEWSVVSGQCSVGSGAKLAMALGPLTCAARERGPLRWWAEKGDWDGGRMRVRSRTFHAAGSTNSAFFGMNSALFCFFLYEFCFFLHVFCCMLGGKPRFWAEKRVVSG
jgi:hypothetical protein